MKRILKRPYRSLDEWLDGELGRFRLYLQSYWGALKHREMFSHIDRYCMFIGYPRSGHSLIGALLDAHPNIIIAHEADTLQYIQDGFRKQQIYYLLLKNSQSFAQKGRGWTGYSYEVPNQWPGAFDELRVIGDKKGGKSTTQIRSNPELLDRLLHIIDDKVKAIHVIRNPYDIIATMSRKDHMTLEHASQQHFARCETIFRIKKKKALDIFDLRLERFIQTPETHLRDLCFFLEVPAPDDYLRSCSQIVFDSPHKSRYDAKWGDSLIDIVEQRIKEFPFLQGYSYEST